jgi:hypothetical protein
VLIYEFTIKDPADKDVNLKTPTHELFFLRLAGKILQKEAISQLIFFIMLASCISLVSESLNKLGVEYEAPNTSSRLMKEVEKQVLPDMTYPAMQDKQ